MKTARNIDEYISRFPNEIQQKLERVRETIKKAVPGTAEKISYQIPAFTLKGNLVYFAAFKKHIGLYPGTTAIKKFEKELSRYEGSKATARFPLDEPLPLGLISKIVKFSVKENLETAEAKGKNS
jgi:uncharacterized protein YdhG (YjbR/CyaY superfamily)